MWLTDRPADRWETVLIPPCKAAMTRPDDIRRFAVGSPTPLFDSDRGVMAPDQIDLEELIAAAGERA